MICFRGVVLFVLFLVWLPEQNESYRILGLMPFEGNSHFTMFKALFLALARHGHQVDVVSHYPLKKPVENYKDIVNLQGSRWAFSKNVSIDYAIEIGVDPVSYVALQYGNELCELLGHEKMKEFMQNLDKFGPYDAIITEVFGSNCYIAFGHYFKAPIIVGSTTIQPAWINHMIRNPSGLAYLSHSYTEISSEFNPHSFWSRLQNTYSNFRTVFRFLKMTEPQNAILKKYFGPDVPDLRTLENNIALTLVNTHYSLFGVRPFLPSVIEVGGIHINEDNVKMSKDLQQWMDESTEGVVFFSLGSLINVHSLPKEILRMFLSSFAKIAPVKVLIKISDPSYFPDPLPNNVKTLPWIPQIPVLRHNNTKVFITHGGIMGSMEALYYEVPMIGIPFFGDQPRNVYMYASKNFTIPLPYDQISEKCLDNALEAILRDPKYKQAAIRASRLFRDRPLNASETAVYWIEYVIRNGADTLKSPAIELYWWQNELLDVYLFLLTMATVVLYSCRRALKWCLKRKPHSPKKAQ